MLKLRTCSTCTMLSVFHNLEYLGYFQAIMDLIEYGADPQLPDAEGRSVELFLNVLHCLHCYKG